MDISNMMNQYVKTELIVLIPVLYFIEKMLRTSKFVKKYIPLVVAIISILLCGLYIFAHVNLNEPSCVLSAVFSSITQGILIAGTSLFGGLLLNSASFHKSMDQTCKKSDKQSSKHKDLS